MKRSSFLKSLLAITGTAILPVQLKPTEQFEMVLLHHFAIRGFQYYQGPNIIQNINRYSLAELVREPDNPYDSRAIAVFYNNQKIGFVPMEDNLILSIILDEQLIEMQAVIERIDLDAPDWEKVFVKIYALKKENKNSQPKAEKDLNYFSWQQRNDKLFRYSFAENHAMNGEEFYDAMIANSSSDRVYELLHTDFDNALELNKIIEERRLVINKSNLTKIDWLNLAERLEDEILELDSAFQKEGYVVANVEAIAQIPDKIERLVKITDKYGNIFVEIVLNKTL